MERVTVKQGESALIDSLMKLQEINEQLQPENMDKRVQSVCAEIWGGQPCDLRYLDEAISALCDEVDKQIQRNIDSLKEVQNEQG